VMSFFSVSGNAANPGEVVGYALSTDITATINGYEIPSYNVDGYIYIIVEDLNYYGFNVTYSDFTRTLGVTRDNSKARVSKEYIKPYVLPGNVGKPELELIYTDIVTYLDGVYTPSLNINGMTLIRFDSLSAYGTVIYDNDRREISLTMENLVYNPVAMFIDGKEAEMENGIKGVLENNTNMEFIIKVRAGASMINFDFIFRDVTFVSEIDKNAFTGAFDKTRQEMANAFKLWQGFLPSLKAVNLNFYEGDGECFSSFVVDLAE